MVRSLATIPLPSPRVVLEVSNARCEVALFGAHIVRWVCCGQERLWMSSLSPLDGSGPIRGGIPIAFPQFADNGNLKLHGFARECQWTCITPMSDDASSTVCNDEMEQAIFELQDNEETRRLWNHGFKLRFTVTLTNNSLDLSLTATNTSSEDWDFSTCLHTYFKTSDIRQVSLLGLQGCPFIDKVDGRVVKMEDQDALIVESASIASKGFVDRIYDCASLIAKNNDNEGYPLKLVDQSTSTIYDMVHSKSCKDTVVFNPWIDGKRGPQHPDFDDDGFNYMICIEPAIAHGTLTLQPGSSWTGSTKINVSNM